MLLYARGGGGLISRDPTPLVFEKSRVLILKFYLSSGRASSFQGQIPPLILVLPLERYPLLK